MINIRIITPLCDISETMKNETLQEVYSLRPRGFSFDLVSIAAGPQSIEGHFDDALAAPFVAIEAMRAEREGMDAVIIDCMGDPGLMAAREVVDIPVIGPGEATMHFAAMVGHRFSCLTVLDNLRPIFFAHAQNYGLRDKLASVRAINLPVLDLEADTAAVSSLLFGEAVAAIDNDHADTIILGCTGFLGVAEELATKLAQSGRPVPVIDPLPTAALFAGMMVMSRVGVSRLAYPKPNPRKIVIGYPVGL